MSVRRLKLKDVDKEEEENDISPQCCFRWAGELGEMFWIIDYSDKLRILSHLFFA